jgi:hypothetical protein
VLFVAGIGAPAVSWSRCCSRSPMRGAWCCEWSWR